MPLDTTKTETHVIDVPSMLDLIRLSPRALFPPGGVELYRQIALLTDMKEGDEVLDVACGKAVSLEYFVREHGVHGAGVEVDPRLVEEAEKRTRAAGLTGRIQIQTGRADALPYRDEIFDITVGEIGLSAHCDPTAAVQEMVRVTKPGGSVVLVQLVWKSAVDEARRNLVVGHLGARPLMMVEWKRRLKEAGVVNLHTEDWADDRTSFRARGVKPFPDFTEIFTLSEKIGILRRAWSRWGWTGIRALLAREREIHRLLTRERTIGLDLIRGTKAPVAERASPAEQKDGGTPAGRAAESSEAAGSAPLDEADEAALSKEAVEADETARAAGASAANVAADESTPGDDAVDDSTDDSADDPADDSADDSGAETAGLPLFGSSADERA